MLTAYCDDSQEKSFVVVGGWVASTAEWDNFEIDWKLFLGSYKVPYFHMREFAHSRGPYAKWKNADNFRARFIHDAWEIIKSRVRGGFVSLVQDTLFNRVNRSYELQEKIPSCYALASRVCMEWVDERARRDNNKQSLCVFDDPGEAKQRNALIQAAGAEPKLSTPVFEASRDVPHRKKGIRHGLVQLQAADFLAWEVRKYAVDHALIRSGVRSPRFSLRQFGERTPETCFFSEERLVRLCERLGIKSHLTAKF
jgi:hypothetical protein